ncbi:MAG: bifunctional oligoribonuclease/PAP phosphatase NrnA [Saprospiraceae bacterium]|nr:bifunctional oligoribonuclease/PAP phosphatase NrnA [Saprospiraceae bacterium]
MRQTELEIKDIRALLELPRKVVVFGHRNPDGDAIGSALAIRMFLETWGHQVTVIFPTDYPPLYQFLPGIEASLISVAQKEESAAAVKAAELIFLLDFNALDRIDDMGVHVQESDAPTLLIDHHLDPEPIADWVLSDPAASSTAELVYLFFEMLGETRRIDLRIATALFTGLLTDTGSFKYSTSERLFRIAADLKALGVDDYWLQNRLFNSLTEKQLRLIGHCIANRMEVLSDLKTGIIYLNQDDYQRFRIQRGDTEGIVNYILMMRHMRIAVFITQQNNAIKLSFRSKGDVSVQELARDCFHGGGHRNAAGGSSKRSLSDTIVYLKEVLPEYLERQGLFSQT